MANQSVIVGDHDVFPAAVWGVGGCTAADRSTAAGPTIFFEVCDAPAATASLARAAMARLASSNAPSSARAIGGKKAERRGRSQTVESKDGGAILSATEMKMSWANGLRQNGLSQMAC
eukprot:CAMPEP_0198509860 /NCGR_PEP_ID=MMETSP1462-20131121/13827_1 /TAXON_ID=1333877 /ORGANISM="Brandtodinium nutriculum, Strain RCC3387" /LENGTH=117 /DNA_ID=CAMNT_0044239179 /DNA_START=634 /DNA_END=986 /DNA_ORIENTATION=+